MAVADLRARDLGAARALCSSREGAYRVAAFSGQFFA